MCEQLGQTWQGKRVDRAFISSLGIKLPPDLVGRLDAAERLAPIMATASRIRGNPRLIKRFLNALAIRMTISSAHGVGVDEAVLAKMLLFERCGEPAAYAELSNAVVADAQGRPMLLAPWEKAAHQGEAFELQKPWEDPFTREWLALPPRLADKDLRGVLYVSADRTHRLWRQAGLQVPRRRPRRRVAPPSSAGCPRRRPIMCGPRTSCSIRAPTARR